jgi:hypothetical protein
VLTFLLTNKYENTRSHFKQFIDFVQLMDILYRSLPSTAMLSMEQMGVFSLLSMNARAMLKSVSLPCLAPMEPLTKFLVVTYGQPVLLFGLWTMALIGTRFWSCQRQRQFPKRQFYHSFWQLVLLCFSTLNYTGFSLLNCRSIGSARVLVSDDAVLCEGSGYTVSAAIGLSISLVISVVVPAVIFVAHKRRGHVPSQQNLIRILSAVSLRSGASKLDFDDSGGTVATTGHANDSGSRSPVRTVSFRIHQSEKVKPFDTTVLHAPIAGLAKAKTDSRSRSSSCSEALVHSVATGRPPVPKSNHPRSGSLSPVRRRVINKHLSSMSTGSEVDEIDGMNETDWNAVDVGGTLSKPPKSIGKYTITPSSQSMIPEVDKLATIAALFKHEAIVISSSPVTASAQKRRLLDPVPLDVCHPSSNLSPECDSDFEAVSPVTNDSPSSLTGSLLSLCLVGFKGSLWFVD